MPIRPFGNCRAFRTPHHFTSFFFLHHHHHHLSAYADIPLSEDASLMIDLS
jgi:hypothetical protein